MQAPLVHYYFPSLDDLFVALLRRRAGRNVERMADALASPTPLRAWWQLASDPRGTALMVELLAAANHRAALKAEVGTIAKEVRRMQMDVLDELLPQYGLDPAELPPALVAAAVFLINVGKPVKGQVFLYAVACLVLAGAVSIAGTIARAHWGWAGISLP